MKRLDKVEDRLDVLEPQVETNTKDIKSLKQVIVKELKSINLKLDNPKLNNNKIWNILSNALVGGFAAIAIVVFIYS